MDSLDEIIGTAIGLIMVNILISCIPAGLWYCFDDRLATVFSNPELGSVPFISVYAFTLFTTLLCKSSSSSD